MEADTAMAPMTIDVQYLRDVVTSFQEREGLEYQVVESVIGGFHQRQVEKQDMVILDSR